MSKNIIYIIGHKSPDLDSVVSAISYQDLKSKLDKENEYKAVVAGDLNLETKYILEKYNIKKPTSLESLEGKKVIMVDHNEFSQALDGIEKAEIIEVIDHHKINFSYKLPINFKTANYGSTCSLIFNEYKKNKIKIEKDMAAIMLAAVLVDTVIGRSPTCTNEDIKIIEELAKIAEIDDWQEYGIEIFKVRSSVESLSANNIIKSDFKDFNLNSKKIGIGQVESVDLRVFKKRKDELLKSLDQIKKEENYHSVILFITDIINEGSLFLIVSDEKEKINHAFNIKGDSDSFYVKGIISRKKQVTPIIEKNI